MKKLLRLLLALLLPSCALAQRGKVVVISLDGFPANVLDDPKLPIPTLRKLMASGTGGPMLGINPTITWPNHTTMVTGVTADVHGLLLNGAIIHTGSWPPVKVDPTVDKEKMVRVPTVYDAAHQAGLTTAQVDWVAINNAPTITWAFPEMASPNGALEREMVAKGAISVDDVTDFNKANIVFRDQIWTKAGAYLIREHKPDLLLVHRVAQIVAAVHDAGIEDRTTILVVSDHGFKAFTKQIRATNAINAAGLDKKVYVLPEGGSAFVYFDDAGLAGKAREALATLEGVDHIYGPDDYAALGLPRPERDPQFGQLWVTAKTGYSFSGTTGGPVTAAVPQIGGSHAYPASDPDMHPIFIATGYGVRKGIQLGLVSNLDVAPTIAKLLGIQLPSAKGKPLQLQ